MTILARRSFLAGLGSFLIAAPAIVHAGNLMPVKAILEFEKLPFQYEYLHAQIGLGYAITRKAIIQNLYGNLYSDTNEMNWAALLRSTSIPMPLINR